MGFPSAAPVSEPIPSSAFNPQPELVLLNWDLVLYLKKKKCTFIQVQLKPHLKTSNRYCSIVSVDGCEIEIHMPETCDMLGLRKRVQPAKEDTFPWKKDHFQGKLLVKKMLELRGDAFICADPDVVDSVQNDLRQIGFRFPSEPKQFTEFVKSTFLPGKKITAEEAYCVAIAVRD